MLYNVYSVYDKTAEEFGPPFCAVNDGIAKRNYSQMGIPEALKNEYELHFIGTFNSKVGELCPELQYHLNTEEVKVNG